MRGWEWLLLAVGLVLFAGQAALSSPTKSAAFDEGYHVTRGYAYLRTGDFRLSIGHPPLINAISALPLLALPDVVLPTDHPAWAESEVFLFADAFLWRGPNDPHQLLVLARLPVIALGTLLVLVLFVWARQMIGSWGGWAALVLAAFDPNLIANSRLVTTDLGVTCFLFLTVWRLWHWLERPSRLNLVLVGLLAGLTMTAKFTGVMIWPIIFLNLVLYPGFSRRRWWHFMAMGLVAYLALWAVYRFDFGFIPGTRFPIPIAAPYYPFSALEMFTRIQVKPKPAFLLGQISADGWWYYFPVALAVKTPLPTLLLAGVSAVTLWRRPGWRRAAVLWVAPLLFLALAMSGRITIGYRHILPLIPFLIMIAAHGGDSVVTRYRDRVGRLAQVALLLLLAWQMLGTVRLFPHTEAYFNELAGGPEGGSRVLADSNIDWGQDLLMLKQVMDRRNIDEVYLAYFGTAFPEAYGVNYKPLPGFLRFLAGPEVNAFNPYTPLPGWYAISVTSLRLGMLDQNVDIYDYFRHQEPVARAGYSINLYEVRYPDDMAVDRTVVTGPAVADLPPPELGLQPGHRLIVKWTRSALATITPRAQTDALSFDYKAVGADFDGAFILLAYDLAQSRVQPGGVVEVTLTWQVGTADVDRPAPAHGPPLAAFVHLSGPDPGQIVAQYDGWQTALMGLEPGDVITHQVAVPVPDDVPSGTYYLRVGLYSPQSDRRLPVVSAAETADFITLTSVTVRASSD